MQEKQTRMNRILKILFLAVIFFMGYLWFGQLFKSCNKPKSDIGQFASEMDSEDAVSLPDEDFFEDDTLADAFDDESTSTSSSVDKPAGTEPIDYNKLDEIIDNKNNIAGSVTPVEPPVVSNPPANKPKTDNKPANQIPNTPAVNYDSGGGDFMVIAGSYLVEANANEMVQTLKKLGFPGAEKVVFDLSKFYSVSSGRYDDHESASKAASKLKSNGIDCYVHRKK